MSMRRIASLTIMLAFVVMIFTGLVLSVVPQGRVAYWAGWMLLGLGKEQWGAVHTTMGLLMLVAGVFHIVFNWKPILNYLKNRSRELRVFTPDFNVSLAITALFVVLTLAGAPPLSWVLDGGEAFKARAARTYGEPPYGHAEQSTVAIFSQRMGWPAEEAGARLRAAGFELDGLDRTLEEIAAQHGVTPQVLFEAMRPAAAERPAGLPASPPPGLGRRSLEEVCEEYGVELDAVLQALATRGIRAESGDTFKNLAEERGLAPHDLYVELQRSLARSSADSPS